MGNCSIRQQSWIFGRDWSLAQIVAAPEKAEQAAPKSPRMLTNKANKFEPRAIANGCLDIAEIVNKADW